LSVVIDASVALKWVLDEPGSDAASALRDEELIAPALWLLEAANALWRSVGVGQITIDEARARLAELLSAPVATLPVEPYLEEALDLAAAIGHPVYDCLYLALALRHKTYVVTADRRFAAAVSLQSTTAGAVRLLT
jgi:predicted nucleic acid-binding protein